MTPFEHLSVLISLILGLGLAHLLTSVHHLVLARERVRFHWLPLAWAALIFVGLVQEWWSIFEIRSRADWTFFGFLVFLIDPVRAYLTASFVLPPVERDEACDLEEYYFGIRRWFFPLVAFGNLFDGIHRHMGGTPWEDPAVWSNFVAFGFILALAVTRSVVYHAIITLILTGLFVFFILLSAFHLT